MDDCRTCELVDRRDRGEAPPWDRIWRTTSWDVVHAYGTAHAGWLVLVTRTHRSSVAELNEREARELGPLLQLTSAALGSCVAAPKTYVAQFAEHPLHPHVHFHVIAKHPDHPDGLVGPRIFDAMGDGVDQVPEDRMNAIAEDVRQYFTASGVVGESS